MSLVPKSIMDDSVQTKNTSYLNGLLKTMLREAAVKIRESLETLEIKL